MKRPINRTETARDHRDGPAELWTVDDLSAYLKKPVSWVYENYRRLFPYYRMGQAIRFDPDEIRAALRQQYRTKE